mmetsp:Transcript_12903/g.21078  ORF Transcript_12903/g.21078 Transcript_12903/m.21078 type:complete len:269 (-) Transcript_12903:125-931(-)
MHFEQKAPMKCERSFVALAVLALFACVCVAAAPLGASQSDMHMRIRNDTMQKRLTRQYGEEHLSTIETPQQCVRDDDCWSPGAVWKYCIKNICQEKSCRVDADCGTETFFYICGGNNKCVKGENFQCFSNNQCYGDECCLPEFMLCEADIQYCCENTDRYFCPTGRCWTESNCQAGQTCVDTYCKKSSTPTLKRTPPRKATPTTASLKPTPSKKITLRRTRTVTLKRTVTQRIRTATRRTRTGATYRTPVRSTRSSPTKKQTYTRARI